MHHPNLEVKKIVYEDHGIEHVPIGTVDTWNTLILPENRAVVDASDVIIMNTFPMWEGIPIHRGLQGLKDGESLPIQNQ